MPSFVKPTTPAIDSATNSTMTGTGRWMDQVTKFMCARAWKAPVRRPRRGFLGLDDVDAVAVLQESGAALDDAFAALQAGSHFDAAVADAARLDAAALDTAFAGDDEHVAVAVAHDDARHRQRRGTRARGLDLAAREHAGARAAGLRQVDVHKAGARAAVYGRRDGAHFSGERARRRPS